MQNNDVGATTVGFNENTVVFEDMRMPTYRLALFGLFHRRLSPDADDVVVVEVSVIVLISAPFKAFKITIVHGSVPPEF